MNEQPDQGRVKGMEARLFLFLVICLFPLLSVALVAASVSASGCTSYWPAARPPA